MTHLSRAAVAVLLSAALGPLTFALVAARQREIRFDMDRDTPRPVAAGFSPVEHDGDLTFAWTGDRALLRLADLNRHVAWACDVRLRGARPPDVPQPTVSILVDDAEAASTVATNEYIDVVATLPVRGSAAGAVLSVVSTPTWHPGPKDPRALGVQVDSVVCTASTPVVLPTLAASTRAALIPGVLALAFVLAGTALVDVLVGTLVIAGGSAVLLTAGVAPFTSYGWDVVLIACWSAGALLVLVRVVEWWRGGRLSRPALTAAMVSAIAMCLKLAALLHPSKLLVDALFQAHRLEAVMGGHYFFTQPLPDGVQFPYAIGLYVFALPWTRLPVDHVALVRTVVVAMDVLAGSLLYLAAVRAWQRPWAGVLAVALFHLVPLPYAVVGNGNLTNAFGQSVALMCAAAVGIWALASQRAVKTLALAALIALGLCSHVSTFMFLIVTLGVVVLVYLLHSAALRSAAWTIIMATVLAVAFATVSYYAHFMDVYAQAFTQVRSAPGAEAPAPTGATGERAQGRTPTWPERVGVALGQSVQHFGWPLLMLTVVGLGGLRLHASGARMVAVVLAWVVLWLVCTAFGTVTRVGPQFERYAVEFLGRVNLAAYPAVALLAAHGASVLWESRQFRTVLVARSTAIVLIVASLLLGASAWQSWIA